MHSVDTVNELVELIHSFYGIPQETMVLLYAFDDGCGGPLQIEQLRNPYAITDRPYADDNEVVDVDMPWREPYSNTVRHYLRFMMHDVTIEPSSAEGWCVPTVIECENRKDKPAAAGTIRVRDRKLCDLCDRAPANAMLLGCHHGVYCYECAKFLEGRATKCRWGACREPIQRVVKLYPECFHTADA
ncbi:hypothetical protein JKP88DRAFT_319710 [Tribonema minus]|uniref:Uncharacterized protein n=1 Tax=Tribonema minus TaxID=303371 RepID=A0A836CDT9_9STRA|nr:hypothetical protein JKP88DRAFT_319710 [Tribonema minus]